MKDKDKIYKEFWRSDTNHQLLNELNHLQEQLNVLINRSKQYYYERMTKELTNVSKNCNAYWSQQRRLLSNKKNTSYSIYVSWKEICDTGKCLETGVFLSEWKKGNIVPVHKKGGKQIFQNYRPVSLLPICGKTLEKLMFNEMFEFFIENKLIFSSQSGLNRVIHVSINCYLLLMRYIVLLWRPWS